MQQLLYILLTFILPPLLGCGILGMAVLMVESILDLRDDIEDFIRRPNFSDLRYGIFDLMLIIGCLCFMGIGVLGIIASLTA